MKQYGGMNARRFGEAILAVDDMLQHSVPHIVSESIAVATCSEEHLPVHMIPPEGTVYSPESGFFWVTEVITHDDDGNPLLVPVHTHECYLMDSLISYPVQEQEETLTDELIELGLITEISQMPEPERPLMESIIQLQNSGVVL